MTTHYDFEREVLQRLVRVEENTKTLEKSMEELINKLDKMLMNSHQMEIDWLAKYQDIDMRINTLESQKRAEETITKSFYMKIGVFVSFVSALVQLVLSYFGG